MFPQHIKQTEAGGTMFVNFTSVGLSKYCTYNNIHFHHPGYPDPTLGSWTWTAELVLSVILQTSSVHAMEGDKKVCFQNKAIFYNVQQVCKLNRPCLQEIQISKKKKEAATIGRIKLKRLGTAAYQLGNTTSRTITEVKHH